MRTVLLTLAAFLLCAASNAQDYYQKLWASLNKNDRKAAQQFLQAAKSSEQSALDAHLTEAFLNNFGAVQTEVPGLLDALNKTGADLNAYAYALWFHPAYLGEYGKKEQARHLALLNQIFTSPAYNGSLKAAARYVKGLHHVYGNEFPKAAKEFPQMGGLNNWQLTGPFENISGSGINMAYDPIKKAAPDSRFRGLNDIEIGWFTPAKMNSDGWSFTRNHILEEEAIVYAQTFVEAPDDMDVLLAVGGGGSLKVWVNDALMIAESEERNTELDYYKVPAKLRKGFNRVLVQLGYSSIESPNFIVRFTDRDFNAVAGLRSTSEYKQYTSAPASAKPTAVPHFAEIYFQEKVKKQPGNLVNYLLLSQAYLRNNRTSDARQILSRALELAPENSLVRFELIQCLLKEGNRTLLMEEIERLKEADPDCYLTLNLEVRRLTDEEKYEEALTLLDRVTARFGENLEVFNSRINLLAELEKNEDLFQLIEAGYKKYKNSARAAELMYNLNKKGYQNKKAAIEVLERFCAANYHYEMVNLLATEYKEQGQNDKYLKTVLGLYNSVPYDPRLALGLADYHYRKQEFSKALDYSRQALNLAPYESRYWENIGTIYEQQKQTDDAIAAYRKSLHYKPANYDARKKLRSLEKKEELYNQIPVTDLYATIKKAAPKSEFNFEYLLDEKAVIIYDKGASEEYITTVVKVYNQKGIDTWKETTLNYDRGTQTLLVEKCEVVKASGAKVAAERNEDDVVFTNLAPGDAIIMKYRLQNYTSGRMGKEYWDKFVLNAFVPTATCRYMLITPKDYQFDWRLANSDVKPVQKQAGDYQTFLWEINAVPPVADEPLMPVLGDIGVVLHVSSVKTWPEIANWYRDLVFQDHSSNTELDGLYRELFPTEEKLTQLQKAKRIYDYLVTHISYSSVSFRQTGLVPQPISKIITTRLGDCKDLSLLFTALARRAGLDARMMLIDTRDNGKNDMLLPSMEFNHCIAVCRIDGKDHYLELTDTYLPFGSLPNNLGNALSLMVPAEGETANWSLKPLVSTTRNADRQLKKIDVTVDGTDLKFAVVAKTTGHLSSGWRDKYRNLSEADQKKNFAEYVSGRYKSPATLQTIQFDGLETLSDTLSVQYDYLVKNDVVEAGSMRMIKLPLLDLVASMDQFGAETRVHPIEYWKYEDADVYESIINIKLSPAQSFVEVPADQQFRFGNSTYSLSFKKQGNTLTVRRAAQLDRSDKAASEYAGMKQFFNQIVAAESKYIVFK